MTQLGIATGRNECSAATHEMKHATLLYSRKHDACRGKTLIIVSRKNNWCCSDKTGFFIFILHSVYCILYLCLYVAHRNHISVCVDKFGQTGAATRVPVLDKRSSFSRVFVSLVVFWRSTMPRLTELGVTFQVAEKKMVVTVTHPGVIVAHQLIIAPTRRQKRFRASLCHTCVLVASVMATRKKERSSAA